LSNIAKLRKTRNRPNGLDLLHQKPDSAWLLQWYDTIRYDGIVSYRTIAEAK